MNTAGKEGKMILNEMANVVLASWIALYHFAAIYVWSTVRAVIFAVSPFVLVAIAFFWRPHERAEKAFRAMRALLSAKNERV
ncbi:hypothetical protein [Burkholderia multivorans]|uniref:hypothetical protein n=1 Tax=Burkholderia multivorans TaxID=87883 RepID=UPI0019074BF0|nr:hypothetical protein [Burkholderia multivorans]MBJ9624979.1 hypothetical protein [Burkholderia multivorans]